MELFEPVIQVRYKQLLIYNKWHGITIARTQQQIDYFKIMISKKTYSGIVTEGTKKRMSKAIDLMLQASPLQKVYNPIIKRHQHFQLTFLTLTIAEDERMLDAAYCYKNLLMPYLRILRDKFQVVNYVWKVELQERGQVHYHLTLNKFIMFNELQTEWNKLQKNLGLLDSFYRKFQHYEPNGIDIHAVYKVNDIKAYLLKYLKKSEQNQTAINSKIWGCSENLRNSKSVEFYLSDIDLKKLQDLKEFVDTEIFKNEHCEIITSKSQKVTSVFNSKQLKVINENIKNISQKSTT